VFAVGDRGRAARVDSTTPLGRLEQAAARTAGMSHAVLVLSATEARDVRARVGTTDDAGMATVELRGGTLVAAAIAADEGNAVKIRLVLDDLRLDEVDLRDARARWAAALEAEASRLDGLHLDVVPDDVGAAR